jgi:hypothetical protein
MADRIKFIIQKRTSLKSQITGLSNLIERERYDQDALRLRMIRVTELYHAFEDFNDELGLLDPKDSHTDEFANVQERYYSLAAAAAKIINPSTLTSNAIVGPSSVATPHTGNAIVPKRRIKLPETSLPNFNGRHEDWLSFKNSFSAMIDTRTDLCDVEKLQYLQSAVTGEAANKIKILTIEGANYVKAWDLLKRAYEDKRILISRHLTLLRNMPVLDKETSDGLSKLADDAQQHVASLSALGVSVSSEVLVNLIESKLPKNIADKWEETLIRDKFPEIDDLYEFIYRSAVRVSKRARIDTNKRDDSRDSVPAKRARTTAKIFMTGAIKNCVACKTKIHPLFKCEKFRQLDVPRRIELIKNAKLCYNCLRSHRGKICNYSSCTVCQKRHNSLLHLDKRPAEIIKSSVTDSKTENIE